MTFSQWLYGGIDNPFKAGQWGPLHIAVMLSCIALIIIFHILVKHSSNKERTKKVILYSLVIAIALFEVTMRYVHCMKLYYFHHPEMEGTNLLWIMIPRPWCAIACWAIMASVFVKKPFFYNYASLSALLCAVIFFIYPGVGFNNVHLLFGNWYSILTHALLLITSITMMSFHYADFKYKDLWKEMIAFLLTFAYGLIQIYVLRVHEDPMYFMPNGDIQADILKIPYGLYLFGYIALILIYINAAHMIGDKESVKRFFAGLRKQPAPQLQETDPQ